MWICYRWGGPVYPSVSKVVAGEDYTLEVTFENGEQGVLDMKPYLDFGIFEKLGDMSQFKSVRVSFDTVEWACGVDLDPEFVHDKCRMKTSA